MSSLGFMLQQRWFRVYGRIAFGLLIYHYGNYESYRYSDLYQSGFRNKSQLFGGREIPESKKACFRSGNANTPSGTRMMIMVNRRGRSTTTTTNRLSGSGRRHQTTGPTTTQRASLTNPHHPLVRKNQGSNTVTALNGKMATKPTG